MNDQAYIRAGVELADGFSTDEDDFDVYAALSPRGQRWLDALAAQLVRQVLATNKTYLIETLGRNRDFTTKFFFYAEKTGPISDDHPDPIVISGKDHTMNTIKAIVDSKVLNG